MHNAEARRLSRRGLLAALGGGAATVFAAREAGAATPAAPQGTSSGGVVLLPAKRLFDSRDILGNPGLQPGQWYGVDSGITRANYIYATLTATKPSGPGFLTVNSVQENTGTSYLNWGFPASNVSNSVFFPVNDKGVFFIIIPRTILPPITSHVVVDLLGYLQR